MERTLESKDHDFRELEVMNRDALHARDIAEREYQRFSEMVAEERAEKKRMIAEKTAMVNAKVRFSPKHLSFFFFVFFFLLLSCSQPLELLTPTTATTFSFRRR